MRIYLDDIRTTPRGWNRAFSVNQAIDMVKNLPAGKFEAVSLDHDLGDFEPDGGDAIKFVDWMAENGIWPTKLARIHTGNPVGRDRMYATIVSMVKRFPEQFTDEFDIVVEQD